MAKANQEYLKTWDDYQNSKKKRTPILLPLSVTMTKNGDFDRQRINAGDVKKFYKTHRKEIPPYMFKNEPGIPSPHKAIEDYLDYFASELVEGPLPESPFDLQIQHPTFILFHLPMPNWKFTKDCQYSTMNDPDDMGRNFVKICTLDNMNALLLLNQHRSEPENLKFNLHVTISQIVDGRNMATDIIIDPGLGNNGAGIP